MVAFSNGARRRVSDCGKRAAVANGALKAPGMPKKHCRTSIKGTLLAVVIPTQQCVPLKGERHDEAFSALPLPRAPLRWLQVC
jgi:hypothetical protein